MHAATDFAETRLICGRSYQDHCSKMTPILKKLDSPGIDCNHSLSFRKLLMSKSLKISKIYRMIALIQYSHHNVHALPIVIVP